MSSQISNEKKLVKLSQVAYGSDLQTPESGGDTPEFLIQENEEQSMFQMGHKRSKSEGFEIHENDGNSEGEKIDEIFVDLNLDIRSELKEKEEAERFSSRVKTFLKSTWNLLVKGVEDDSSDEVEKSHRIVEDELGDEAERKRDFWNLYGILGEKNLGNCFGSYDLKSKVPKRGSKPGLGTIMGVVIPVILNIFGVILFLRLPMGIGNSGILLTIVMFTMGYCVTTLTVLSISAIATNGVMKGGGSYFMISRILGPEIGGAIGFIFFLANVAGGALYVIGFLDSLAVLFPSTSYFFYGEEYWSKLILSSIVLVTLTIVCLMGADIFSKTGLLILIALSIALVLVIVSFAFIQLFPNVFSRMEPEGYVGWNWGNFIDNFWPFNPPETSISTVFRSVVDNCTYVVDSTARFVGNNCSVSVPMPLPRGSYHIDVETQERLNFQKMFGILFPACTGAMAGANLSGDLARPNKSIPRGTIFALVFTYIVYIFLIILFGTTITRDVLITNYSVVSQLSLSPIVVSIGIFSATISSGLTSIIGGSRVLNALAKDNLLPFLGFASLEFGWPTKEPRFAVVFTAVLIQVVLFVGKIGFISPLVTEFFLIAYGMVNFACFLMCVARPPNFRPSFKWFNSISTLVGFLLCVFIMFYVDWIYSSITIGCCILVMVVIFFYAKPKPWGDVFRTLIYFFSKKFQHRINQKFDEHVKYWRLKVLVLIRHPSSHFRLLRLFNDMAKAKGGLGIIGMVKQLGNFRHQVAEYENDQSAFYSLLKEAKLDLFFEITFSESIRRGVQNLLLHAGFSGMNPDIVCIGWYEDFKFEEEKTIAQGKKVYSKRGKKLVSIQDFSQYSERTEKDMSLSEYMNSLIDILIYKKGVVISRYYKDIARDEMKPKTMFKRLLRTKSRYIDVWVFQPSQFMTYIEIEHSVSLALQLANLLMTGSIWKKFHKLRLVCVTDSCTEETIEMIRKRYKTILDRFRIDSEIKIVQLVFPHGTASLVDKDKSPISSSEEEEEKKIRITKKIRKSKSNPELSIKGHVRQNEVKLTEAPVEFRIPRGISQVSLEYDQKLDLHTKILKLTINGEDVSIFNEMKIKNRTILTNSNNTSLIFLTLPPPPQVFVESKSHRDYYRIIDNLTRGLKPVFLCYSKVNVISTDL